MSTRSVKTIECDTHMVKWKIGKIEKSARVYPHTREPKLKTVEGLGTETTEWPNIWFVGKYESY